VGLVAGLVSGALTSLFGWQIGGLGFGFLASACLPLLFIIATELRYLYTSLICSLLLTSSAALVGLITIKVIFNLDFTTLLFWESGLVAGIAGTSGLLLSGIVYRPYRASPVTIEER
jgi:hypothetical protein